MSIKQTLAQLKAMGCKATYSKDWEEYRVTLPTYHLRGRRRSPIIPAMPRTRSTLALQ